jgi:hypothetical protein
MLPCPPPTLDPAQIAFWWSGAAAFVVAALSGGAASFKYWRELKARRWDRAHKSYEGFLDIAINNPEFISGYWSEATRTTEEKNKFRWFMARFLWAAEQALLGVPERRKEWEQVVKVMLREHRDFITASEAKDEVDCYYGPLRDLIAEIRNTETLPSPP